MNCQLHNLIWEFPMSFKLLLLNPHVMSFYNFRIRIICRKKRTVSCENMLSNTRYLGHSFLHGYPKLKAFCLGFLLVTVIFVGSSR